MFAPSPIGIGSEVCHLTYFDITSHSWLAISHFFKSYLTKDRTEYGYNWARIINNRYLRDYSPKEMIYLAGIFVAVIEKIQGPGIWSAEWAKGQSSQLEQVKQIGYALFEATKPDLDKIVGIKASLSILARARQLAGQELEENGMAEAIRRLPI